MLTKNERMNALNAAGINTSKYFTVDLDNGTKIHLIIDENGNPVRVDNNENDPILNEIITDGYVRNTKLFRRFVMGQMFSMLNYVSYDKKDKGYNACLRRMYGYNYTFNMMLEEIRVLSKLEARDKETFEERVHFFDKNVVAAVMEDYLEKLKKYVDKLPNHKCKGVPYKKIKSENIFVDDLDKKLYAPVRSYIYKVKIAKNYAEVYKVLSAFMSKRRFIKLPYNTAKSKVWIDAYKGSGAFYTLKNLVMYHGCKIYNDYKFPMYGEGSALGYMNFLNAKLDEYKGEGWRMFALMKKVIKDNNFDFNKRMNEIYNK